MLLYYKSFRQQNVYYILKNAFQLKDSCFDLCQVDCKQHQWFNTEIHRSSSWNMVRPSRATSWSWMFWWTRISVRMSEQQSQIFRCLVPFHRLEPDNNSQEQAGLAWHSYWLSSISSPWGGPAGQVGQVVSDSSETTHKTKMVQSLKEWPATASASTTDYNTGSPPHVVWSDVSHKVLTQDFLVTHSFLCCI